VVEVAVEEVVLGLYRAGLVRFGEFKLSSGVLSPFYIDLRSLPSHPGLYRVVVEEMARVASSIDHDVVMGVESSGIIHAASLSCLTGKPVGYVRKRGKDHGLRKRVEGVVNGKRVLVVDDVSTTGSSILDAVEALRVEGAVVEDALVIIDRGEGAGRLLGEHGVRLHRVLDARAVFRILEAKGLLENGVSARIREYYVERGFEPPI
jgi:orotate phosphoribosyltransferase